MKLTETFSVCPVCLKRIKAAYVRRGASVYLEKNCGEHGDFSCLIASDTADFEEWGTDVFNIRPKDVLSGSSAGCPHDCGPCENHMQTACCVLIDVTDRCNQRCGVCFASASPEKSRDPALSEIEKKYDELIRLSEERKFNIQLSGGEPTVREDLPQIIKMAKDKGFEYVQLNTNGKRLGLDAEYAYTLKEAGLDAAFMQFDGMSDVIYEKLRNERLLETKKNAIENCRRARLPAALVPTLVKGVNDGNIGEMIRFAIENADVVKGIHFQPVSFFGRYPGGMGEDNRFTMFDTINEIERQSDGLISKKDLLPISTGHNLCCFYATYLKQEDGSVLCTSNARQADPGGACCESRCCTPDIAIISKDRDYVLNKWKMSESLSGDGFDMFINHIYENSFTLTGMAFQDAMSLDAERLRRCRVQVLSEENKLIPFCAYNLTDLNGGYLYRKS